jgi:hypothetical protein
VAGPATSLTKSFGSYFGAFDACGGNVPHNPSLTRAVGTSSVEELPWFRAGRSGAGKRLILENSTACRKSMHKFVPVWDAGAFVLVS